MNVCSICPKKYRPIGPDGPAPADVLLIGERPGQSEQYGGRPFIGQTGKELNENYLPLAGLDRDSVRLVNTVRCFADQNKTPTPAEIAGCAGFFMKNVIRQCEPKLVVLMGSTACSLVPEIELEKEHGIPRKITADSSAYLDGYEGWVFPSFHPSSGLHNTGMMIPLLEDFERLGKFLGGRWHAPTPSLQTDYSLVTEEGIRNDIHRHAERMAVDTEDDLGKLWSIQYSTRPGTGRLLRVDDSKAVMAFENLVARTREVVLHNSPHDISTLGQIGIKIPRFRDTMQEAYHLGNQPQGLKALAYRLLGVRMQSWEDLVTPPSRQLAIDWLMEAWDKAADSPIRSEKQLVKKLKVTFKPNEHERTFKRILSHSHKPDYDIWEKVEEKGLTGYLPRPIPRRSIVHAPLEEAIAYGCRDADMTLQVANWLEKERERIVTQEWKIDDGDVDA